MKKACLACLLIICFQQVFALAPPLEREISLDLVNEPVRSVLNKIQEQTGLIFSYQPVIIQNTGPVTLHLKQKTVREALAIIFPKNVMFKQKNNYIILKEKPENKDTKKTEMSGYVVDKTTDKKLSNVTIYDKKTLTAVTTDEYGFYSIKVPNQEQCIKVNKENYQDTCISPNQQGPITNITINPINDSVIAKDTANFKSALRDFGKELNGYFKKFKGYVNTLNIRDTLNSNYQVSFLPFVGTNGALSGNVYNDFSFNVLGGYSRGNKELEVGGLFNLNKEKMTGVQVAGLFNVVGDTADGVQVAGLINVVGRHVEGFQVAGALNLNLKDISGVQASPLVNINLGKLKGLQLGGFVNLNQSVDGVTASGFMNVTRYSVRGVQLAGLLNISGDTLIGVSGAGLGNLNWHSKKAVEIAGLFNHSQSGNDNTQVSGFFNSTAQGTTALQVSGFINIADNVSGMQVGILNYCNKASGVPIGLLSIVKQGLHQFDISSDELFLANISFRTGVHKFYNVFTTGFVPTTGRNLWHFGYGAGTSFKINQRWRGDLSATASHLSAGSFYRATSELFRFYIGTEYKIMNKFSLAFGPTFNLYWGDNLFPDYNLVYANVSPYKNYHWNLANQFVMDGWWGTRVGLRFL